MTRTLIFDTETTDLIKNSLLPESHQPKVIEFFGLVLDESKWSILEDLEFFCDPGKPLEAETTKITGIKTEDVAGQPPFKECAEEVKRLIESCSAVVAHNLSYDMAVIDFEMKRAGLEVEWPIEKICTVESTEHLKGHRLKLSDLHELLFGEGFKGAHRASVDVMALMRCYTELVQTEEL